MAGRQPQENMTAVQKRSQENPQAKKKESIPKHHSKPKNEQAPVQISIPGSKKPKVISASYEEMFGSKAVEADIDDDQMLDGQASPISNNLSLNSRII